MIRRCPALLVSAPASGQGKTLVTAALAQRWHKLGRRVRLFKIGPDFLDPMILETASGQAVYQLDLFMGGEAHCRQLLYAAAAAADVILIEGVMGLFDGQPSSADLAILFDIPVLAVIDASAMAETFAAVAHGLAGYRAGLRFAGAFANRVGGARHAAMLQAAIGPVGGWYGALAQDEGFALPERHLGLVQAAEIADLKQRIERTAAALDDGGARQPEPVAFTACLEPPPPRPLAGKRIAVALDAAFAFVYRANLDLLAAMGADVLFFSPLRDETFPVCDALWLPGGYPELYLAELSANATTAQAIRAHHRAGRPILAECGGMLYLCRSLRTVDGRSADMLGVLPADAVMQARLCALGLQSVRLPGGELRGHTFHHSQLSTEMAPMAIADDANGGRGEAIYRLGALTASYVHFYFPANPTLAASLFLR